MFRPMRLQKQQLSAEETETILKTCTSGVLAVCGDDGYPYAVPLSYDYEDGRIYFHCATSGHKLDAIKKEDKVSFCVVAGDEVHPGELTTYYRSVIVFGRARILETDDEKRYALERLAEKYSSDFPAEGKAAIEREWKAVTSVVIEIDHSTGKAASEILEGKA